MGWFSKIGKIGAGFAINPILGSGMAVKEGLGLLNKIPSRGYNSAGEKMDQAYDLYDQNSKKNPYNKYYDPRMRQYQTKALNRLYNMSTSKKLDPYAQAQLDQIRRGEDTRERGAREAIMMNANERGAGTSTGTLMSELMNSQSSADRRTGQDTQVAGEQWRRALDALYGSADMSRSISAQDMQRAQSEDMFNRYNLSGKAGVLGQQGNLAIDKANAQNQFWGGLIGTAAGAIAGGPAGASAGGSMGGGMMGGGGGTGISDYWSQPYSGGLDYNKWATRS